MLNPGAHIHFIGIGGIGMSGIAKVAHAMGFRVSGSDIKASNSTESLESAGICVSIGHSADNLPCPYPDVVVISTAILENNPELVLAKEKNLQIWHRAEMLAALGQGKKTLAVSGTHGKTSTSSMLATVVDALGENPSFLIGGVVHTYASNAHVGSGDFYIVEADESDKSFTYLNPAAVLVTNIELDHLDHYNDLSDIRNLFSEFMASVPADGGICVICADDKDLVGLAASVDRKLITYGFSKDAAVRIYDYQSFGQGCIFDVAFPDSNRYRVQMMHNPGKHNAQNAAGVLAMCYSLGLDVKAAAEALSSFKGVKRRFDRIGDVCNICVVDDYAHHPTEIAATINAAKDLGFKKVHVLFQPHRYSRAPLFTEILKDEFSNAFIHADTTTIMDVYSAGEMPIPGVTGKSFMKVIAENPKNSQCFYIPRRMDVIPHLLQLAKPGDLVITMGAGDVSALAPELVSAIASSGSAGGSS